MDWFDGTILDGIQTAKRNCSLFVVFVHGGENDETSQKFSSLLNDAEIAAKLSKPDAICIKLENGSEPCTQFSQIYPVFLVPSIYFIDSKTGLNIEATAGEVSKEKILASIKKAMDGKSRPDPDSLISPRQERVEAARQTLSETVSEAQNVELPTTPTTSMTLEEKVERAKRLLAETKAKKEKEAEDKVKDSEVRRREEGKNMQAMKQKYEDEEIRKAAEERQKEKEEARLAKQKVMEQIAQDRAERAQRFKAEKEERDEKRMEAERQKLAQEARRAEQMAAERSTVARIQFRLPDGSTRNHKFSPEDSIGDLYKFVIEEMQTPYGNNVSLSTTFPSRELDNEPKSTTLRDATLVPSTTILILPRSRGTISPANGNIFAVVWLWFTSFLGWISAFFTGGAGQRRPEPSGGNSGHDGNSASGRSTTAYKRRSAGVRTEGNIARLTGNSDDDETNTYNGNSTQQM